MKAVFVHDRCLLRDSHIDPASAPETWRLEPATLEAIRTLGANDTLVMLWGRAPSAGDGSRREPSMDTLVKQVEAAGGHVDALITCPHGVDARCQCWGEQPSVIWVAASELELDLTSSYVLADDLADLGTAHAAGVRPVLVLGGRTIGAIVGDAPAQSGYPIATDLTAAASYIGVEDDIARQLGHARAEATPLPSNATLYADPAVLPDLHVTSAQAQSVQARVRKSRVELTDLSRWLTFFVLGAVGLSLGIAYILTHLYRQQPFPDFVYYISLQFIPRPLRGALFIAWGVGVLVIAFRSFYRSAKITLWPPRKR